MKEKSIFLFLFTLLLLVLSDNSTAQCAMCTKTASQLGEKPALGLNNGIIYLMLTPLIIMGVIAYRWWKSEKGSSEEPQ
jgi:hypothetical protein